MESLPVKVIGNILSLLGPARDVVIASATCWKWREAWKNHVYTLSFNSNDWPGYHVLHIFKVEVLITQTLIQTAGLQCLSIEMDDVGVFSDTAVIPWLIYTRRTLRELVCKIKTTLDISFLEKYGQKLELVAWAHSTITGVKPSLQIFPCLRSLTLCCVTISTWDLGTLVFGCRKLEVLALSSLVFSMSDGQEFLLSCSSLKDLYVEAISLDKIRVMARRLEILHLKDCAFKDFKLMSWGAMKILKIDDVRILHFDIGDNFKNLEVVDVNKFMWPKFLRVIWRSSKLTRLRLWGVVFDEKKKVLDLETISLCFPQLSSLSLSYNLRDEVVHYSSKGSSRLEKVVELEVGWTIISDLFLPWVEVLLARCPNLEKLVIYGDVSKAKTDEERQILVDFISSSILLLSKYVYVKFQFEFE